MPWDEASLALSDALRRLLNLPVPVQGWRRWKKDKPGDVPVKSTKSKETT